MSNYTKFSRLRLILKENLRWRKNLIYGYPGDLNYTKAIRQFNLFGCKDNIVKLTEK